MTFKDKHIVRERRILIKGDRLLIDTVSEDQHTGTLIDLAANTLTEIDFNKKMATAYPLSTLRPYVYKGITAPPSFTLASDGQLEALGTLTCRSRELRVSVQAMRSLKSELIGHGTACLLQNGDANQEYESFFKRAIAAGAVLNYTMDNALTIAFTREQTELYAGLANAGGIPLRVDIDSRFEGGALAKMWNVSANRVISTTKNISQTTIPSGSFDLPGGIVLKKKDH